MGDLLEHVVDEPAAREHEGTEVLPLREVEARDVPAGPEDEQAQLAERLVEVDGRPDARLLVLVAPR